MTFCDFWESLALRKSFNTPWWNIFTPVFLKNYIVHWYLYRYRIHLNKTAVRRPNFTVHQSYGQVYCSYLHWQTSCVPGWLPRPGGDPQSSSDWCRGKPSSSPGPGYLSPRIPDPWMFLIINKNKISSVADQRCLSRMPDPDFDQSRKIFFVLRFSVVATNIIKL